MNNYDRIKAMTIEEMTSFFAKIDKVSGGVIRIADHYICQKCKNEHNGKCPMGDDEKCLYDNDNTSTIKYWLEGEANDDD